MVKITKHVSGDYDQFRITIPIWVMKMLRWEPGDEIEPEVHQGGLLLRKVEKR